MRKRPCDEGEAQGFRIFGTDLMEQHRLRVGLGSAGGLDAEVPVIDRRQAGIDAGCEDAGDGLHAAGYLREDGVAAAGVGIALLGEGNPESEDTVGMETHGAGLDGEQGADHQAGADQEHDGKRDFPGDEHAAEELLARAPEVPRPDSLRGVRMSRPERWRAGARPKSRAPRSRPPG